MTESGATLADHFGLEGRVALVTGAASGIGEAIAHAMATAGARVVVMDRNEDGARTVAEQLVGLGHDAAHVAVDLAHEASVLDACRAAIAARGAPWILVNNAGIQNRAGLLDTTAEFWDLNQAVNTRGAFLMTREIGRAMADAGQGGRIINVCSLGSVSPMVLGLAAYSASKAGLRALTMTTAFELAEHGITANAVHLGGVGTPGALSASGTPLSGPALRTPPLGYCEPQDIAAAVLFLASPAARRLTNQAITVDAGFSLT